MTVQAEDKLVLYMDEEIRKRLEAIPDEKLLEMSFSAAFQQNPSDSIHYAVDSDGFPLVSGSIDDLLENISDLQKECWVKFNTNPQINTAITDNGGSVCGKGFKIVSHEKDVKEYLYELMYDSRNRLYTNFEKFVIRSEIEGELFLCASLHEDGFVEIDFMSPGSLKEIHYHPFKQTLPLLYEFNVAEKGSSSATTIKQIPSIYVSEFASLAKEMESLDVYDKTKVLRLKTKTGIWKKTNGYQSFIISWDKGLFTKRNVSSMRTTIEWANHYENLKRYEIDHKKSSGSYLWVFSFEDPRAFKNWLSLSEEDRLKTGVYQKKTPGGSLVLPPGMKVEVKNPQLPKISDSDTDIMHMITSGLNKPEDMVTGQSSGTYGSVKASRGPESDRNENRKSKFRLFLIYDFFKHIFRLKNFTNPSFKLERVVDEVVDFKDGKEIFEKVKVPVWECVDVMFPVSEVNDIESRAKAYLGVKHGSLVDALGIPPSDIAEKLGFVGYKYLRMKAATEKKMYPELISTVDSDLLDTDQEKDIEKPKEGVKVTEKKKKTAKTGEKKKV